MLAGRGLIKHVNGTRIVHPKNLPSNEPNPDFENWYRQDQQVLSWLLNSIFPSLLPQIIGVKSAREAWTKLENAYASGSKAQVLELKNQLSTIAKSNSESISDYMQRAKLISDKLASLQKPIPEEDLVDSVLNGLGGLFRDVSRTFASRTISFDDLFGVLLTEERHLNQDKLLNVDLNTPTSHYTQKQSSGTYRGRGRGRGEQLTYGQNSAPRRQPHSQQGNGSSYPNSQTFTTPLDISTVKCHNCQGFGHMLHQCPSPRLSNHRQSCPPSSNHTTVAPTDNNWILDSGATHHLTSDLGHLNLHSEYLGPEEVHLGPQFQIGDSSRAE